MWHILCNSETNIAGTFALSEYWKRWWDKTFYKGIIIIFGSLMLNPEGILTWDCRQRGEKIFNDSFPFAKKICIAPIHAVLKTFG